MQRKRGVEKFMWASLLLLVISSWAMPALAQFTNGDFSQGPLGCNAGTGWTTTPGAAGAQRTDTYQPGNVWLDLTPCNSAGNGTWIEQAVPVTIGACYRVDFDLASHCGWDGSRSGVFISVDGQPLGGWIANDSIACPAPFYWERKSSLTFVAQNNPTIIRFTGEGRCRDYRTGARPCAGIGQPSRPEVIALDNIELVQITNQTLAVDLGKDTVYCEPFTRVLDAGNSGSNANYLWNTGDQTQTISVSAPGTYHVTVTTMCGTASDTIQIRQGSMPDAYLGADTLGCAGSLVTIAPVSSASSGVNYLWSTGETSSAIQVSQSGDYWLAIDDGGCVHQDTIHVEIINIDVDLGDDISICETEGPVTLTSSYGPAFTHLWSNGLSDTQLVANRSDKFWVEVSLSGCKDSDTINIDLVPEPVLFIGSDTVICEQFPLEIGASVNDVSYSWNTGQTTPFISVDKTGEYILSVTRRGCTVADTILVTAMPAPVVDLGGDRDICPEETIVLDATVNAGGLYSWSTGEQSAAISVDVPGTYSVHLITSYGCIGEDTVTLFYYPLPVVRLDPDTSVCEQTPLVLTAWAMNADSIIWSNGVVGKTITVQYEGVYLAEAFNKCGSTKDTINVKQIFCDIWIPNSFTPNNDGKNDVFRVTGNLARVQDFSLSVFNRWGERVYYSQDKTKGWDGMHNGAEAGVGTYLFVVEYSFEGVPYQQKGSFHLIR